MSASLQIRIEFLSHPDGTHGNHAVIAYQSGGVTHSILLEGRQTREEAFTVLRALLMKALAECELRVLLP